MKYFAVTIIVASILHSGSASEKSTEELTTEFKELDKNNDGFIEPKDLYDHENREITFIYFLLYDTDKDGKLSLKDYNVMYSTDGQISTFKNVLDKDADGYVTMDDMLDLYFEADELEADYITDELMSLFDKNGDGSLDFEEFTATVRHAFEEKDASDMNAIFKEADQNDDGKITREELREFIFENLHQDSLEAFQEDFLDADVDGDYKLSLKEYTENLWN